MPKNFFQIIEDQCDKRLVDQGFQRPREGTRYLEITEDFLGWVGLNHGNHVSYIRINPFIGIHCVPIMKLRDELEGKKYKKGSVATYAIHLGEICPDVEQFIFDDKTDVSAEAKRLSDTIVEYAVPWMKYHAKYDTLMPLIQSRMPMLGGYPQSVALGYYLMNQPDKAHQLISSRPEIFERKKDDPKSIYNRFTKPFLTILSGTYKL